MKIEKATRKDAKDLSELTIRSKSHWNYSKQQIEIWRDDLTISEDYILEKEVYKLFNEKDLIGYYSYARVNQVELKMENLFVDHSFIGKGFGKMLMLDFLKRIRRTETRRITLEADPNAEEFYRKFGFEVIGKLETSISNRFLPIMKLEL